MKQSLPENKDTMRICDVATMPLDMQPLSKLHSYGSAVLSDSELLNIIFGSRTISRLTIDMIFGLFVNSKGVFIKSEEVSIGSTDSAVMSIREIIRRAIMSNSSGVVLVHNHPSGNFDPSPDDIQLSKRMKEAMEICNLKLVDSIIIGDNGYCSLSERGIL